MEGGTRLDLEQEGFCGLSNLVPRIVLGFDWRRLLSKKLPAHLASRRNSGDGAEAVTPPRSATRAADEGDD